MTGARRCSNWSVPIRDREFLWRLFPRETLANRERRRDLTAQTRIKRITRRTIFFFKTIQMCDIIELFVNQYEFVKHDLRMIRCVSCQESRSHLIGEKRHRVRDQLRTKTTAEIRFHHHSGQPHGLL